ncbi:MAG: hypothetical protein P4M14_13020 [Gammaproteobacteria bacterium]|nr:hypothetical protein [Gammaproteobacteria bacterium]
MDSDKLNDTDNLDEGSTMALSRLFSSDKSLNTPLTDCIEIKSETPTPIHSAQRPQSPLMQYSSFSQSRQSQQKDQLEQLIAAEEEKFEPLMQAIYEGIQTISDKKIRTLLTNTFANDVRNIPDLQKVIRKSACNNVVNTKCCCMCCGLTAAGALAASMVSGLFVGVMGIFGAGAWKWGSVAVAAEYGAMAGGGAGFLSASAMYLAGFYQLVQLSQTTKQADQIILNLSALKNQYNALAAERQSPVDEEQPGRSPMHTVRF